MKLALLVDGVVFCHILQKNSSKVSAFAVIVAAKKGVKTTKFFRYF